MYGNERYRAKCRMAGKWPWEPSVSGGKSSVSGPRFQTELRQHYPVGKSSDSVGIELQKATDSPDITWYVIP